MLPFPQIISLEQKYTHHVVDVHDVRSLQQFLPDLNEDPHPVETSNKVRIRKCLRLLTFWVDHVMAGPLVTFSLNSIN